MLIQSETGFVNCKGVRGNMEAGLDPHVLTNSLHWMLEDLSGILLCYAWDNAKESTSHFKLVSHL